MRTLREGVGLSGVEAARRAGMSQATISRFETGKRVPTADDVRALCEVFGAPAATRRKLLALAEDLREGAISARTLLHRAGAPSVQQRIGRIEATSARIRSFQPTIVIGLLQTADYMRALLSGLHHGEDLAAMVAARLARQQILDTDRSFHLVLTESALRWHVGAPDIMARQVEHLVTVAERPHVQLGIVPWTRPVTHPVLHAFQIYDQRAVMVGTETAVAVITDARDVADYETRFEIYAGLADYDDDARRVLRRVADEYRALQP
ncbi:MAG: helix-turn-helix transcriptional regulator [Actinomycetota bacterium]|nr:helix-turn-helix transcriptional regulator [Actinomycetota bacterium]